MIVHLYFDYSPVPATVLDIKVQYDSQAFSLVDTRPLSSIVDGNKQLMVGQTVDEKNHVGKVRLVVLSKLSSLPVEHGPVAELVFQRTSPRQGWVRFTNDPKERERSMAPFQGGSQQRELATESDLWGYEQKGDEQLASAYAKNGPQLMVGYNFNNPKQPMDPMSGLLGNDYFKNGAALCSLVKECRDADQDRDTDYLTSMLDNLQNGIVGFTDTVDGVDGKGIYLNGVYDHLELPVWLNEPLSGSTYEHDNQSFSFSMWFLTHGFLETGGSSERQVLFSRNTQSEVTQYGLMLVEGVADETVDLVWFEGDLLDPTLALVELASGLDVRTWNHLGVTVNAQNNKVFFYLNGERTGADVTIADKHVAEYPSNRTDSSDKLVALHKEADFGQIVGQGPQMLYFASSENNQFSISGLEMNGLVSARPSVTASIPFKIRTTVQ